LFNKGGIDSQLLANGVLMQLLASFVKKEDSQVNPEKREMILRFQPALDHIEKHLGEKLSVTELAQKVSLERAYFSTLFSKTFNISPALYINRKRIERTQKLLCETNLKLEAISQELGFTDAFHLSKTFKKFTGISPSEFRKRKPHLIP
jgi:transcriptional regulator GlxA family with amidase domain